MNRTIGVIAGVVVLLVVALLFLLPRAFTVSDTPDATAPAPQSRPKPTAAQVAQAYDAGFVTRCKEDVAVNFPGLAGEAADMTVFTEPKRAGGKLTVEVQSVGTIFRCVNTLATQESAMPVILDATTAEQYAEKKAQAERSGITLEPLREGQVRYRVAASCPVNVTYSGDGGSIEQQSDVEDGWSRIAAPDRTASLSAQLTCEGGTVQAFIEADAGTLAQASSSGDYVIASTRFP